MGIFNLPHHVDMVWEQLPFDDAVTKLYTVVEIQNGRGDGMRNQTTDLQIRSLTLERFRHSNYYAREDTINVYL